MELKIEIKKLPHGQDLPLPSYATLQSAGMDLYAAIENDLVLDPLTRLLVPSGIVISILNGFEGQIRPRSGMAVNHGITVSNSPGTIDSDYRGEIKVCLINLSNEQYRIKRGDRIAQIVINPVTKISWHEVEKFTIDKTDRGTGGFGSSGE
jgi:dUTP pyrophosphatase